MPGRRPSPRSRVLEVEEGHVANDFNHEQLGGQIDRVCGELVAHQAEATQRLQASERQLNPEQHNEP